MKVILPIACSGAGKTTYWRTHCPDSTLLEADLIREELTGDIGDIEHETEVWKVFFERFRNYLKEGKSDIYLSEMHVSLKGIKEELSTILQVNPDYDVEIVVFDISDNWEECYRRVEKDLKLGVNRSPTVGPMKKLGNKEIPLIQDMSRRFHILVNSKEFNDTIYFFISKGLNIEVVHNKEGM